VRCFLRSEASGRRAGQKDVRLEIDQFSDKLRQSVRSASRGSDVDDDLPVRIAEFVKPLPQGTDKHRGPFWRDRCDKTDPVHLSRSLRLGIDRRREKGQQGDGQSAVPGEPWVPLSSRVPRGDGGRA